MSWASRSIRRVVPAAIAAAALLAAAPARADDKREARTLMKEGVRLFDARDLEGALSLFRAAYAKYPSAKILLNIAGTLTELGRDAEAANTYQAYLDAEDKDPDRVPTVTRLLAELDTRVVTLAIAADVEGAEVQVDTEDWRGSGNGVLIRVAPGHHVIRARATGLAPIEVAVDVGAGAKPTVPMRLKAPPPEAPAPAETAPAAVATEEAAIAAPAPEVESPVRLGVTLGVLADGRGRGAVPTAGLAVALGSRVEARAAAVIGAHRGGYVGAAAYLLDGSFRPLVSLGLPVMFSNGARLAVRGGGGVAWEAGRHVAVVVELGVERWFNAEMDIDTTQVVPTLFAIGRL